MRNFYLLTLMVLGLLSSQNTQAQSADLFYESFDNNSCVYTSFNANQDTVGGDLDDCAQWQMISNTVGDSTGTVWGLVRNVGCDINQGSLTTRVVVSSPVVSTSYSCAYTGQVVSDILAVTSNPLSLTGYDVYQMEFLWQGLAEDDDDYFTVVYSTDQTTWTDLSPQIFSNNGGLVESVTLDMTALAGQNIYFGFRWVNDDIGLNAPSDQVGVSIDDVYIRGINGIIPNFSSDLTTACEGSTVQFYDESLGNVTSWNWTVTPSTGVTITNPTDQNPTITFTDPGFYSVTLDATGPSGTETITQGSYIEIVSAVALPFFDDFETFSFNTNNWLIGNPDAGAGGNTWQLIGAPKDGPDNIAAYIDYYSNNYRGQKDYMETPPLDVAGFDSLFIDFEFAYSIEVLLASYGDSLLVEISTDCGATWETFLTFAEDGTGTFATSESALGFTPEDSSDWCGNGVFGPDCVEKLDLSSYLGTSDEVKIRFTGINDFSSVIYIDDVNIYGVKSDINASFEYFPDSVCLGGSVQFTDLSTGDGIDDWNWDFPGGTPATSDDQNPMVVYNTPGTYDVTLEVCNSSGACDDTTVTFAVFVDSSWSLPYSEDFESGDFVAGGWSISNGDGDITWDIATVTGNDTGSQAAFMDFYDYSNGIDSVDILTTPKLDFRPYIGATLSFEYAYVGDADPVDDSDTLHIEVSGDCGASWDRIFTGFEDGSGNFNTSSWDGTEFAPSVSDHWCLTGDTIPGCFELNLDAYIGNGAVQVRFVAVNRKVNNLYIDNILIEGEEDVEPMVVDFSALPRFICAGSSVSFTDQTSGTPITWEWEFEGGSPSSSGTQNPVVTYDSPGTYAVKLKTCNTSTCDSLTRNGYIVVGDGFTLPVAEDFESGETFGIQGWSIVNPDGDETWQIDTVAGSSPGVHALHINNDTYTAVGERDYLVSPPLDFTAFEQVSLSFDHAYQGVLAGNSDSLLVEISEDCGATWTTLLALSEDGTGSFATAAPALAAGFNPADSDDWCTSGTYGSSCISINLDAYGGKGGYKIRFQNINGNGNDLYLDNINITGVEPGQAPEANFGSEYPIGCVDQAVQFTDYSLYNPTDWQWVFEGGSPSNSTDRNPVVSYSAPGRYSVSLIVTNSFGGDTLIRSNFIEIVEDRSLPFSEDFESGLFATRDWYVSNPDTSNTWTIEEVPGNGPGSRSAKMSHWGYGGAGKMDYLVSPPFDFRGYDSVFMSFEHAYALFSSTTIDSLIISVSSDCGSSWERVTSFYDDGNGSFATRRPLLTPFTPQDSEDWCFDGLYGSDCKEVDLSAFAGRKNVKVRFDAYNAGGNNVYIDDINLYGVISLPTAKFTASPRIVCEGDTVWFTNESSSNSIDYEWSFAAGTPATSTDSDPFVVYNTGGQHAVSLKAINAAGSDEDVQLNYITVLEVPKLEVNLDPASCGANDGSISLTTTGGTGPYTYVWSMNRPGDTTATLSNIPGGLYEVTVINQEGCSTTQEIVLPTKGSIQASIVDVVPVSCNNESDGSMRAIGSGGISPYTYQWNTPNQDTTPAISGLPAGVYTCVVRDAAGCIVTVSASLSNPESLTIVPTVVNDDGSSNGSVSVSVSGGTAPYSYLWRTPGAETTSSISGLEEGTYQVLVTDARGCRDSIEAVVIYEPKITITVEEIVGVSCNGEEDGSVTVSVSGGTYPYTYFWDIPFGAQYDSIAENLGVGNYELTVTDAMGVQATLTVFVGEESPLILNASATPDNGSQNGTATANISGGVAPYTFVWSTSPVQTGNTATGLKEGKYTVTVTDAAGCVTSKEVTVIGSYQPLQAQVFDVRHLECAGDADGRIEVSSSGGVPPLSYQWNTNPAQLGPVATSLPGGIYTCTITDAYGNVVTVSATVNEPSPMVVTVSSTPDNGNGTGSATANASGGTAPYTYRWDSDPPQFVATATGLSEGTYTCVVRDANECVKIVTVYVDEQLSLEEAAKQAKLQLYPNPSQGMVSLEVSQAQGSNYQLMVFNHLGQQVFEQRGTWDTQATEQLYMSGYAKGMYYIQVSTDSWSKRMKLIFVD